MVYTLLLSTLTPENHSFFLVQDVFIINNPDCRSLAIIGILNFISFGFYVYFQKKGGLSCDQYNKIQIAVLVLLNLMFALVTFINPGIVTSQIVPSTNDYCDVCQLYKA